MSNEAGRPLLLVVEDNAVVRRALERQLAANGYQVVAAESASEAIHAVSAHQPDLMILDLKLDAAWLDSMRGGFTMLSWLRRMLPDCNFPIIIYTSDDSAFVDETAQAAGIYAVYRKSDSLAHLLDGVRQALEQFPSQTPPETAAEEVA